MSFCDSAVLLRRERRSGGGCCPPLLLPPHCCIRALTATSVAQSCCGSDCEAETRSVLKLLFLAWSRRAAQCPRKLRFAASPPTVSTSVPLSRSAPPSSHDAACKYRWELLDGNRKRVQRRSRCAVDWRRYASCLNQSVGHQGFPFLKTRLIFMEHPEYSVAREKKKDIDVMRQDQLT